MPEQGKHKDMHTRRNGLVAVTEQACLLNTKKAICSSLTLAAHETTLTCPEVLSSWSLRRWTMQIGISWKRGSTVERTRLSYLSKSWSQGKNAISSFLLRSILVSVGSSTTILGTRNDRQGWVFGKSSCNTLNLQSKCERRTSRFDTKSFRYKSFR